MNYLQCSPSKRQQRRRAKRDRQITRALENKRAIAMIKQDYNWSAATWGGTKCADCDRRTEPRMQINSDFSYICTRSVSVGEVTCCLAALRDISFLSSFF